jgi:hypothetical protein
MAIAPQARESEATLVGFRSNAFISGNQFLPVSLDLHIPPLADAIYTRVPPGATAIPTVRPLVAGLTPPWPCLRTEGPIGIQLLAGGGRGGSGLSDDSSAFFFSYQD